MKFGTTNWNWPSLADKSAREVLQAGGVQLDCEFLPAANSSADFDYIHRSADGAETYFVANRSTIPFPQLRFSCRGLKARNYGMLFPVNTNSPRLRRKKWPHNFAAGF